MILHVQSGTWFLFYNISTTLQNLVENVLNRHQSTSYIWAGLPTTVKVPECVRFWHENVHLSANHSYS